MCGRLFASKQTPSTYIHMLTYTVCSGVYPWPNSPLLYCSSPPLCSRPHRNQSQMVDKIGDETDDNMQEVDESALVNINVTVSPAMSPRGEKLQREIHVE